MKLTGKGESFIELGDDVYGNLTRIENKLAKIPDEKEMEKRLQVLTEELGVDDSNMLIDTAPEEEDAPEKDPQDRE